MWRPTLGRCLLTGVAVLATSACISFSSIKPPATPVTVHTDVGSLVASEKLVVVRSRYRARSGDPFRGKAIAENEVLNAAANEGKRDVFVDFRGRREEKNEVGSALYEVIEASSVEFVEPTAENVGTTLTKMDACHEIEARSAMHLVESRKMKELSPKLIAYIKDSRSDEYVPKVVEILAQVNGSEAHDELVRVLKFHSSEKARVAAGDWLIRMGDRPAVEDAIKQEKSENVARVLKQKLL